MHSVPVAVLDIWMAGMTGLELLLHLGSRSPQTRVIFITGREDYAAERMVMQAGAFAFLLKPLDDELFLDAIQRAFEGERPVGPGFYRGKDKNVNNTMSWNAFY
jgi:FixJ family two-component response regulator